MVGSWMQQKILGGKAIPASDAGPKALPKTEQLLLSECEARWLGPDQRWLRKTRVKGKKREKERKKSKSTAGVEGVQPPQRG